MSEPQLPSVTGDDDDQRLKWSPDQNHHDDDQDQGPQSRSTEALSALHRPHGSRGERRKERHR